MFNALDLMENKEFLDKLKFGIGDGNLQYYLYNWKCPFMEPENVSFLPLLPLPKYQNSNTPHYAPCVFHGTSRENLYKYQRNLMLIIILANSGFQLSLVKPKTKVVTLANHN